MKEQDKYPANQIKEEEIGNLPEKEFQILIVNGNGIILINNYLKRKWIECPNQKTKTG